MKGDHKEETRVRKDHITTLMDMNLYIDEGLFKESRKNDRFVTENPPIQ